MKFRANVLLFPIILSVMACSSLSTLTKQTADFTAYKTYRWSHRKIKDDALIRNPILLRQIKSSVDQVLQSKGFQLSNADSVDFEVLVFGNVQSKSSSINVSRHQMQDSAPWAGRADVASYDEGTLVIEIIDVAAGEMVWRNFESGIVGQAESPEKLQAAMDKTVARILQDFPQEQH